MILIDANLLIYAVNLDAHHQRARGWLEDTLSGTTSVGLPWICLLSLSSHQEDVEALQLGVDPGHVLLRQRSGLDRGASVGAVHDTDDGGEHRVQAHPVVQADFYRPLNLGGRFSTNAASASR